MCTFEHKFTLPFFDVVFHHIHVDSSICHHTHMIKATSKVYVILDSSSWNKMLKLIKFENTDITTIILDDHAYRVTD